MQTRTTFSFAQLKGIKQPCEQCEQPCGNETSAHRVGHSLLPLYGVGMLLGDLASSKQDGGNPRSISVR